MKNRTYFVRVKVLAIAQAGWILVLTGLLGAYVSGVFEAGGVGGGLLLSAAVLAGLLNAAVLMRVVIAGERNYRSLCRRFTEGKIYREFIDRAGELFPGLGPAVGRLDGLLDRQNVIQLSTKQAEFLALQNQINPHFLYNTLEAIRGDALCAGMENIADIAEALSTFFRYTITETRNLVTIQEELDNVENYFKIQQYRFGEKLSMDIRFLDDEKTISRMQCPKLSLQPVIENAIFHGLEKKKGKGLISVTLELVDEELHIDINDNGLGIEENKLAELNDRLNRVSVGYIVEDEESRRGGIALKNVCRRIKLLFGEEYGIHIDSIVGIGTKVTLSLPIIVKTDENKVFG